MNFRAVMICDFNNPISMAYSKVALKTWEPIKNVKVERWQCYTPDTLDSATFEVPWGKYSSASKYSKPGKAHKITLTEKACLTSMFHWWKHIAESGEKVIILEHDAFVRHPEKLNSMLEDWKDWDVWCPGIAAECIYINQDMAKFMMRDWLEFKRTIDAGPLAEIHTKIWQYTKSKMNPRYPKIRALWPTLGFKNEISEVIDVTWDQKVNDMVMRGLIGTQTAPVTQCYYPGKQTIQHHKKLGKIGYKDATYNQMEILESLDYE
jgi:hypothetical protein